MKKILFLTLASIIACQLVYGQSSSPTNIGNATRFLGYTNNFQLLFRTFDVRRAKFNQTISYPVNGFNLARDGYFLLSPLQNGGLSTAGGLIFDDNRGAFSILHLNGRGIVQEFGVRPWWNTGITLTDNSDAAYIGLRQVGTGIDVTEMVINWTDNNAGGDFGPDDMVFRFTSQGFGNALVNNTNYRTSEDLDGLHVARFTAGGFMGLGNTFGVNPPTSGTAYARPQSLLHLSYDYQQNTPAQPLLNEPFGFMQITYRRPLTAAQDTVGQGEQATDGLRLGIDNDLFGVAGRLHLNSYLRWQEASSFIIQTEDDLTPNIQSNERMRITSIGALRRNHGVSYVGLPSPTSTTRVSISESGVNPITRPLSLLHLGYNYNTVNLAGVPVSNNGWRPWMDLGMLTSNARDHVFIGLKPRDSLTLAVGTTDDKLDAVIAWGSSGENLTANPGPDVMRFIFTSDTLDAIESDLSKSYNGLEVMRLFPSADTTTAILNRTYGRVGIGDFTAQGVNEQPTHKLDVVGNGRFRGLPDSLYIADSTVNKIVMVDSNGVLRWSSFIPTSFGAECSDTINGKLLFDTQVNLNDHNLYFTENDSTGTNQVGIGYPCGDLMEAKLNVLSFHEVWGESVLVDNSNPVDPNFQGGHKSTIVNTNSLNATGVYGIVAQNNTATMSSQIGVMGEVKGFDVKEAVGVKGVSKVVLPTSGSIGGRFLSEGSSIGRAVQAQNTSVQGSGTPGSGFGFGGDFSSITQNGQNVNSNTGVAGHGTGLAVLNTGVRGLASGNGNTNIGVYGDAFGGTQNWAGYFQGNVYISGSFGPSDQNLKENVNSLTNADSVLNLLHPVSFTFKTNDYPQLNLLGGTQMGVIAQEVEQVLPSIVTENTSPAQYDTLGNEVYPSVTFKTVDYTKVIPLLIAGHQEQKGEIESRDSIIIAQQATIDDLNNRLTQLENCLSGILPFLCQMSQSAVQANTPQEQEAVRAQLSVQLSNRSTIVLDQNVPNPFAEQTVINFSIPETVQKAQIHFYDGNGKLIQSVDVNERGLGSLTVFGSDLSRGTYTYTLVADGVIVATKKMMKQ